MQSLHSFGLEEKKGGGLQKMEREKDGKKILLQSENRISEHYHP